MPDNYFSTFSTNSICVAQNLFDDTGFFTFIVDSAETRFVCNEDFSDDISWGNYSTDFWEAFKRNVLEFTGSFKNWLKFRSRRGNGIGNIVCVQIFTVIDCSCKYSAL